MLDLADIPFFSQLSSEGLARLRHLADVRFYAAGSVICRKGEAGGAFFAVASGGVNIQLGPDCDTNISLRPGQVFGEMSLLSGMPISATVSAARDTSVYALSKESFLEMLETQMQQETGAVILRHEKRMAEVCEQKSREILLTSRIMDTIFNQLKPVTPASR